MKKRVRRLYIADYLITPDRRIENGAVLCENERILAVGGLSGFSMESQVEAFEFKNAYVTPGFIDTHIHGAGGFDASSVDLSPKPIEAMSRILAERGVTAFFPTVVAAPRDEMIANLRKLAEVMANELPGADAVGINVEGPFINPFKRGAQLAEAIVPIDIGFARELIEAGNGLVKVMTFAPELKHSTELVELLLEYGIKPSMGHSVANEEQTLCAIDAGASYCTHLFNGMSPLHQREMGLSNIALTDDRVTVELIIDGRHINPRMVDLACRCKSFSRLVGISDCTMAAGMPNGEYRIGPTQILVKDGYSQTLQGVMAGTTTMLDTGWHSLMSGGHLSDIQSAVAVTSNPARVFNLQDRGTLMPNCRADLAIYEDKTNRPLLTVCNGEIVYRAEDK
ncbi:MAG: N-acetylglucosamine-6-phosphate deacetylase [Victivallales bacterium]|jgi:N-acetylglucosamine-6-phosphate deacetylase|nr:N-acetylglucosamine-6-phosphate deacetylase [Victivallales bacterium]